MLLEGGGSIRLAPTVRFALTPSGSLFLSLHLSPPECKRALLGDRGALRHTKKTPDPAKTVQSQTTVPRRRPRLPQTYPEMLFQQEKADVPMLVGGNYLA
jgi:hypothetical protein